MIEKIGSLPSLSPEATKTQRSSPRERFQSFLDQALAVEPDSPKEASGVQGTAPAPLSSPVVNLTSEPIARTEQTLVLLERLAAALSDPKITPKAMAPLVEALDKEADELLSASEKMAPHDRAQEILRQTAIEAKVQVAKYQRGDFI